MVVEVIAAPSFDKDAKHSQDKQDIRIYKCR